MRKLKIQVQTTVDGYMGGPNGEFDWMAPMSGDDVSGYVWALTEPVDRIVLGRNLAEGFIPAWASGPRDEPQYFVDKMNDTPKVVISNGLAESPWPNAVVAGGDLAETITKLKAEPGGDLIAYGGSRLVSSLIAAGLVDELHLFVNPTAIGAGLPVFAPGGYQRLRPVAATPFECGITALHFEPQGGQA